MAHEFSIATLLFSLDLHGATVAYTTGGEQQGRNRSRLR